MDHSSIETLEPRWAPARLVAGPLPAEFGVDLSSSVPELEELVVGSVAIELPEFEMWPGGSAIALIAQWSKSLPDFATRAEVVRGLVFHASLPEGDGDYRARSVMAELSQDQREALEARLAARVESGETSSSASLTRLGRG